MLGSRQDRRGRDWLRVQLPIRPNGSFGWIRADYAKLRRTPYWVRISTGARTVSIYRRGSRLLRFRAVVGEARTPTPRGLFAIWEKTASPTRGPFSARGRTR